jgi:hypothetical protein
MRSLVARVRRPCHRAHLRPNDVSAERLARRTKRIVWKNRDIRFLRGGRRRIILEKLKFACGDNEL